MFDQQKFSCILENIISKYGSLREFSNTSGFNRTSVSKYVRKELANPPSPSKLKDISDNSKGVTTYEELMEVCGYLNLSAFSNDIIEKKLEVNFNTNKNVLSIFLNNEQINELYNILKNQILEQNECSEDFNELKIFAEKYNLTQEEKAILYAFVIAILEYCSKETKKLIKFYKTIKTSLKKDAHNKIVKIPVVGTVAAGEPILAQQNIIDYEELPAGEYSDGEYFGLKIKGNSMFPRILEDDVVIVKKQTTAETGQIAVVLINGDEATVKQIKKTESGIMLIPFNTTEYSPMFFTKEDIENKPVKIIGIVKRLIGYNFG